LVVHVNVWKSRQPFTLISHVVC